jgi:AraC-like DNA-binding protein
MLKMDTRAPVAVDFGPEGVFVFESRHGEDFAMAETVHDYWKLLLSERGEGTLLIGRRAERMSTGDLALLPPGTRHRWADGEGGARGTTLYGLCVRAEVVTRVTGASGGLGNAQVIRQAAWRGELRGAWRRLLAESGRMGVGRAALVTGHLWLILGLVWRGAAMSGEARRKGDGAEQLYGDNLARARVEACWRQLEWDFHEEWTLNAAAERAGLGRRQFSTLFREVAGATWVQALAGRRVEHARRLLKETERSVGAIAFECGFGDLSHFYRVFRAANGGVAPEAWRRARAVMDGGR